ncbi:sugar ABC transporter permease [Kribbella turkmenica]|uniref:Sugar ABC transporter permease n=1 Tax=Kribbella turkmenica TaxID=2530375 RepID=A0A4R4WTV9_9ACTN|nr:sugar ABC transporter permease [Kribbella turkmenica]TDD21113.1 sugar ABC transporter permease [Kribbella turkmenica]
MSLTTTDRARSAPAGAGNRPRPAGRRRFTARTALVLFAFMVPALVFVGMFTYYPLLSGIQMAFRNYNLNDLSDTSWVGLDNFRALLDDEMFRGTVKNSVVWVVGSLVPQFLIGFTMAMWLRRRFRFRGVYQALVFFPWAVSGFLIGILFRWMFNGEFGVVNDLLMKSHLIDTPVPWLADARYAMFSVIVANVWYGVTFFAIMILAALQGVPEELYESAAIDGAGKVRTLFSITIPSIRTTLALTVLLRVIWIFNSPELIFGMTGGGPANETHIVTSHMIQVTQEGDYGRASAMGVMVVFVLMLFAVFYLLAIRPRKGLA